MKTKTVSCGRTLVLNYLYCLVPKQKQGNDVAGKYSFWKSKRILVINRLNNPIGTSLHSSIRSRSGECCSKEFYLARYVEPNCTARKCRIKMMFLHGKYISLMLHGKLTMSNKNIYKYLNLYEYSHFTQANG